MWNNLSVADLEQARQQLAVQREEILRRHAEEIGQLDADEAEIQALDQLAAAFIRKFQKIAEATAEPGPATEPAAPPPAIAEPAAPPATKPPAAEHGHGGRRSSRHTHDDDGSTYPQTNFEVFSRAAARV